MSKRFSVLAVVRAALLPVGGLAGGIMLAPGGALAQGYKPGDRVECNIVGSTAPQYEKYYEAGTVIPFNPGDGPDGSWYPVKADSNGVAYPCKVAVIRPIRGGAAAVAPVRAPAARATTAAPAPQPARRMAVPALLNCPIQQTPVKNGARPDPETIKRVIRCAKGEKAVAPGDEGAVSVEVASILIGAPRAWSYRQDAGNGKVNTQVWPVKATYTVRTHYRAATETEANWIRVLNFYVDPFGEWKIGSEEAVKAPAVSRIPNG